MCMMYGYVCNHSYLCCCVQQSSHVCIHTLICCAQELLQQSIYACIHPSAHPHIAHVCTGITIRMRTLLLQSKGTGANKLMRLYAWALPHSDCVFHTALCALYCHLILDGPAGLACFAIYAEDSRASVSALRMHESTFDEYCSDQTMKMGPHRGNKQLI